MKLKRTKISSSFYLQNKKIFETLLSILIYLLYFRPSNPTKPIVKGRIHAHSFRLKWDPPNNTGGAEITEYLLEINSGTVYSAIYRGKDTEATCDNLTPGTTYQLRVCCFSSGGQSNYSDPCTVTTDAVSPGQCGTPKLIGKPKSCSIMLR